MTDIFVRTRTNNPIRLALADACLHRLDLFDQARLHLLCVSGFFRPPVAGMRHSIWPYEVRGEPFHSASRAVAQDRAVSDVYVVIDDDCLPLGRDWLERGLEAMAKYPEFSALASWSINGEIDPAKCALPAPGEPVYAEIFEVPSLGTPTFIRLFRPGGARIELKIPDGSLGQYDGTLSAAYLEHGRIGMLRHVRHNHLGYGLSEVVPEWWLA